MLTPGSKVIYHSFELVPEIPGAQMPVDLKATLLGMTHSTATILLDTNVRIKVHLNEIEEKK